MSLAIFVAAGQPCPIAFICHCSMKSTLVLFHSFSTANVCLEHGPANIFYIPYHLTLFEIMHLTLFIFRQKILVLFVCLSCALAVGQKKRDGNSASLGSSISSRSLDQIFHLTCSMCFVSSFCSTIPIEWTTTHIFTTGPATATTTITFVHLRSTEPTIWLRITKPWIPRFLVTISIVWST